MVKKKIYPKKGSPNADLGTVLKWDRFISFCSGLDTETIQVKVVNGFPVAAQKLDKGIKFF